MVLLVQLAVVAVVYAPSLRAEFVSDVWSYLVIIRGGAAHAVLRPIGYHWQPVAVGWVALLRATFGEHAVAFQAVNLLQLVGFAFLVYLLGRRLQLGASVSLLGSLLAVASAAHYEAAYWPLAGNMHLIGVQFYLVSLVVAHDLATGRLGGGGSWLLGLTTVAAIFSHPAMVTVIPVCGLILVLASWNQAVAPRWSWSRAARLFVPLIAAAALFFAARVAISSQLYGLPGVGFDRDRLFWLSARGLAGVFSMRGSSDAFVSLMTLGSSVRLPDPRFWWFVDGWILAAAIAGAWCWWRGRWGVRFLIGFLAIHLVALTIGAGGVTSRQSQLLAAAAALLTACALGGLAERVRLRWGMVPAAMGVAAVLAALLPGVYHDHRVAARLSARSARAAREVASYVRARTGPGKAVATVTLVNMPPTLYEEGLSVFLFHNSLTDLVRLASRFTASGEMRHAPVSGAPAAVAHSSVPITLEELRKRAASPEHLVLLCQQQPGSARVIDATSR